MNVADRAVQELRRDWCYKAGIEDGHRASAAETRHMEAQRDLALTEFYRVDPVACAALCDERLDKSGALLGRVREWTSSA